LKDLAAVIARVLLDTGPLVALLAADDSRHEACVEHLHSFAPPLLTSWPVLVEADWLLRNSHSAVQQMMLWIQAGTIRVLPLGDEAIPWITTFLRKYRKLKPQMADASLVYLAEQNDIHTVFTLDRRDFLVYRFGRNQRFRVLPED
jgi:predicted nucleic acid-binding protein